MKIMCSACSEQETGANELMQKQALHDTQIMSKFRVLTMKDERNKLMMLEKVHLLLLVIM